MSLLGEKKERKERKKNSWVKGTCVKLSRNRNSKALKHICSVFQKSTKLHNLKK